METSQTSQTSQIKTSESMIHDPFYLMSDVVLFMPNNIVNHVQSILDQILARVDLWGTVPRDNQVRTYFQSELGVQNITTSQTQLASGGRRLSKSTSRRRLSKSTSRRRLSKSKSRRRICKHRKYRKHHTSRQSRRSRR